MKYSDALMPGFAHSDINPLAADIQSYNACHNCFDTFLHVSDTSYIKVFELCVIWTHFFVPDGLVHRHSPCSIPSTKTTPPTLT